MCCREIFVVQSPYIFYMQQLEDVVNTGNKLHVWTLGVHDIAALWELPQFRVTDILRQHGVVLVGKVTPQALHTYVFSPLQLLEQWYTVEDFSIEVPAYVQACIAVVEELHVVDKVECSVLNNIREVSRRHDEQREWHLVPLCPGLQICVYLTP